MPAMNMFFSNINFTPSASGFNLECEQLIPSLNNSEKTPMENYPISNLRATISNGRIQLSFSCETVGLGSSVADNSYHVTAEAFMFASDKIE